MLSASAVPGVMASSLAGRAIAPLLYLQAVLALKPYVCVYVYVAMCILLSGYSGSYALLAVVLQSVSINVGVVVGLL